MSWLQRELEALGMNQTEERYHFGYLIRLRRTEVKYLITIYGPEESGSRKRLLSGSGRKRLLSGSGQSLLEAMDRFCEVVEHRMWEDPELAVLLPPPSRSALERVAGDDWVV